MKETFKILKKDTKQIKHTMYYIGRLNILKISVTHELIFKFNVTISVKMPKRFFWELNKLVITFNVVQ